MLPQIGCESKPQQAGYLFFDAYRRDTQAWDLAQSSKSLMSAFSGKYSSDQYGGLLWISAFTYRYFFNASTGNMAAAGSYQPLMIVLLAALVGSLGVPFVYLSGKRISDETDNKTGLYAALIFAFFPEAILLGAAQMREPFLMTFIAIAFYGLIEWQATRRKRPWIWIIFALFGMLLISPGFVVVTLVASAGWIYLSNSTGQKTDKKIPWQLVIGGLGLLVLALVVLTASWSSLVSAKGGGFLGIIGSWARDTTRWNAYLLERSSGIVQVLFQTLPPILAFPFVAVYGVLQPVLPAAVFEPGIPFWQTLGILRALGWYLLLPLIAFAPLAVTSFENEPRQTTFRTNHKQWLWLACIVWVWIFIAALRGGGDQWDNPRYRVILLVWLALLAATSLSKLTSLKAKPAVTRWFWRICSVEAVILLVFGHWYTWRYLGFGFNIGIRNTLIIAIGLSILIVLGDWLLQRIKSAYRL
ncbi:MAG: phospholipid carrier-dependent glycosyltransferase [Chloroflexota bacterium]